jgi:hypothetical protein
VSLSALLGKVENAPAANAANPNLIIVFICTVISCERVLRPHRLKPRQLAKPLRKNRRG